MSVSCQASAPVSPSGAPPLSFPHNDVNLTAAGDGLEVLVTDRYRMTLRTDDLAPL